MKKKEPKRYYIKDVEKILGVKRKTLFYWEKTNKIPKSHREKMSNYRWWTEAQVSRLRKITGVG